MFFIQGQLLVQFYSNLERPTYFLFSYLHAFLIQFNIPCFLRGTKNSRGILQITVVICFILVMFLVLFYFVVI